MNEEDKAQLLARYDALMNLVNTINEASPNRHHDSVLGAVLVLTLQDIQAELIQANKTLNDVLSNLQVNG